MGYKPTLGGLKKAQEYLAGKGSPMPVFQMEVFAEEMRDPLIPWYGRTIPIQEAIKKYGPLHEVVHVRISSEDGERSVHFRGICHLPVFKAQSAMEGGEDCAVEFSAKNTNPVDLEVKKLVDDHTFMNIARFGKPDPSFIDLLMFRFCPVCYANKVFRLVV